MGRSRRASGVQRPGSPPLKSGKTEGLRGAKSGPTSQSRQNKKQNREEKKDNMHGN